LDDIEAEGEVDVPQSFEYFEDESQKDLVKDPKRCIANLPVLYSFETPTTDLSNLDLL
jgi:hypothetical protein